MPQIQGPDVLCCGGKVCRGTPVSELSQELGLLDKGEQLLLVLENAGQQTLHSHQNLAAATWRLILTELHCMRAHSFFILSASSTLASRTVHMVSMG